MNPPRPADGPLGPPADGPVVRRFEHGTSTYGAACELRRRFLREPLGLTLTEADTAGEAAQLHFGLFDGPEGDSPLIGGLIANPADDLTPDSVRVRQVVLDEAHRGRGLGRRLMEGAERLLAEEGYRRFVLFARPAAAPFYERCGYSPTGERAELIGLEHVRMEKRL